jgi:hypothetical protein
MPVAFVKFSVKFNDNITVYVLDKLKKLSFELAFTRVSHPPYCRPEEINFLSPHMVSSISDRLAQFAEKLDAFQLKIDGLEQKLADFQQSLEQKLNWIEQKFDDLKEKLDQKFRDVQLQQSLSAEAQQLQRYQDEAQQEQQDQLAQVVQQQQGPLAEAQHQQLDQSAEVQQQMQNPWEQLTVWDEQNFENSEQQRYQWDDAPMRPLKNTFASEAQWVENLLQHELIEPRCYDDYGTLEEYCYGCEKWCLGTHLENASHKWWADFHRVQRARKEYAKGKGYIYKSGFKGNAGEASLKGKAGEAGLKGKTGEAGLQGKAGKAGPQGKAGTGSSSQIWERGLLTTTSRLKP